MAIDFFKKSQEVFIESLEIFRSKIYLASSLLALCLKSRVKAGTRIGACKPVFMTALFTPATRRKQPRCPPADEYIKRMWCRQALQFQH